MSAVQTFVDLLVGRREAAALAPREWDGVIGVARSEAMLPTLAHRLEGADLPPTVAALFADQRAAAAVAQRQALWEAEMARRALAPMGIEFVLLKGAAYAAAGMACATGRQIGDLQPVRERCQHRFAARDADHPVPVARLKRGRLATTGEQVDKGLHRAHFAASAQSCSTNAMPVALSG